MNTPKFSIVIASYNFGQFIEQAILSVINQNYNNYELIIIDGGSSDQTVEIIKKNEQYITYWVSEKDNGQSDAFNKGFTKATGEFFFWLNADDVLMPRSLERIAEAIHRNPDTKWFAANTIFFNKDNQILRCRRGPEWHSWLVKNGILYVYGPSAIFHQDLFQEAGGFDLSLHYTMDTDLWMRFANLGYKFKRISHYVWGFRVHDESKTSHSFTQAANPKFTEERVKIQRKNNWMYHPSKAKWQMLYKFFSGVYLFSAIDSFFMKNRTIK